ncbi:MAG TPA: ATP-binding protein [candidate division Zixibacteria bacterium]|nr:ATP-binding protein [candidate division Zixibacteria bacterium]
MTGPIIKNNTITIPSLEDYLPDVDNFVEGLLENYGLDKSLIADIAISVTEAVVNAIVHGNKSILEKVVSVTVNRTRTAVEITVVDQGEGFNPDEIDNPIDEANLLKEVGRGIFIVRSLMDEVKIEPSATGTKITLIKNL